VRECGISREAGFIEGYGVRREAGLVGRRDW